MNASDTILVTGATGLVGSALIRALKARGFSNVWDASRKVVDFENEESTKWYFDECKPDYVFHCAAKVGGIADNIASPATFLTENLRIQNNVFCAAHRVGVKKLLFVSSAAVYPEKAESPLSPDVLMTGPFDETKSGYAMAKLCGMQLCKEFRKEFGSCFISVIPNNIYGPGDRSSHVIPDLIRRFHAANLANEAVTCWGTGNARREFIYVDDLADACIFLMENYNGAEPVNVGAGRDWTLQELATLIARVMDFQGEIIWDASKPEGTARRLLDCNVLLEFGWRARTCLRDGLVKTYNNHLSNYLPK